MSAIVLFRGHVTTHAGSPTATGRLGDRRRGRSDARFRELLARRFVAYVETELLSSKEFESIVDRIAARELDPYTAVAEVLGRALQLPNS